MIPSHQQPRNGAAHMEQRLFGLIRTRLSLSIVLLGAVGMLAACGASAPSVGDVATAIMPTTELPTLETTPSVTGRPTSSATDTTDTTNTIGTPATGATSITAITPTPDTDTTGTTTPPDTDTTGTTTTDTTTTPDTDTTGTTTTDTTTTPDTDTTGTPVSDDASAIEVSLAELMEDPDAFLDQQVIVESTVQQVYDPLGVELSDETTLSPSSTMMLIVVGEEQLFSDTTDWLNESVEAMGTLREFNETEFEREFSWFDADADWVDEIEPGQPVLIADMITPRN